MNKPTALILFSFLTALLANAAEPSLQPTPTSPKTGDGSANQPRILLTPTSSELARPIRKPDILFVPTPEKVVEEMLTMAKVGKDDLVYDLGCGDGRIVITAAKKFGAHGVGIDIDPRRITEARQNAQEAEVQDRVKFLEQDLYECDFKDANVITLYLLTSLNLKLRPKIFEQVRPGTRIVAHAFAMGDWWPDAHKVVEGSNVFYWVVPANVSGQWKVNRDGKPEADEITIEQNFQKVTATAQVNGESRKIGTGIVAGEAFTFTVDPETEGGKPVTITGHINGDQIEASSDAEPKTKWTAQRDPSTKRKFAGAP
ncbi:SAM-dependent methyltransferase [Verrucomicrobiota bacterium sgz303538]